MVDFDVLCSQRTAPPRRKQFAAAALALVLILTASAPAAADDAKIEAGQRLALKICAKCHLVAAGGPAPVLRPQAPSFSDIAARPDMTAARLKAFLGRPHGGERRASAMPPFLLTGSQTDAAIAYLMSLKPQ